MAYLSDTTDDLVPHVDQFEHVAEHLWHFQSRNTEARLVLFEFRHCYSSPYLFSIHGLRAPPALG